MIRHLLFRVPKKGILIVTTTHVVGEQRVLAKNEPPFNPKPGPSEERGSFTRRSGKNAMPSTVPVPTSWRTGTQRLARKPDTFRGLGFRVQDTNDEKENVSHCFFGKKQKKTLMQ